MDITVKGRHIEVSERFRAHVADKLAKLERFGQRVTRIDVEICAERNPRLADQKERVELTCLVKGPVIRAEAAAPDAYAALDMAAARLEARLRRVADRRRDHHVSRASKPAPTAAPQPPDVEDLPDLSQVTPSDNGHRTGLGEAGIRDLALDGEPCVVREKLHHAAPMTLEQALFEMELVGHDFFLFVDQASGLPSVVYRRRGFDYGVIRLASETARFG